jgi:hypothetical protein
MNGITSSDPVDDSLARAATAGMQVWLGLVWSDEWWQKYANDSQWLDKQVEYSLANAQELWNLYGAKYGNTIAGFYIPMEVDNDNFSTDTQQTNLKKALKTICDYVHANCGGKPVMNAPFCNDKASMSKSDWQSLWGNLLNQQDGAAIDIIALQDGCGASDDGGKTTHTTTDSVGEWFMAIKSAIASARPETQLWSDLETYRMDAKSNCLPAPESRIEAQIIAEKCYVSKFTSYSTVAFQDPAIGDHAAQYQAYKNYAITQIQP